MANISSTNNKLQTALLKLGEFSFENLPLDRIDDIWARFEQPPYSLNLEELSALKNARCSAGENIRSFSAVTFIVNCGTNFRCSNSAAAGKH